jgi:hypothetical protein
VACGYASHFSALIRVLLAAPRRPLNNNYFINGTIPDSLGCLKLLTSLCAQRMLLVGMRRKRFV